MFVVPVILALFTISSAFSNSLTISVYNDKFQFTYHNVFGNFLSITNTYYFDEVKSFHCHINEWKLSTLQVILMVVADLLLPGNSTFGVDRETKAVIEIKKVNKLGEAKNLKFDFGIKNNSQKKALQLIEQMVKHN